MNYSVEKWQCKRLQDLYGNDVKSIVQRYGVQITTFILVLLKRISSSFSKECDQEKSTSLFECTTGVRANAKRDGTRAETRIGLSAKRTSPFQSAGGSVQSTTGSRGVWSVDVRRLATHSIRIFPLHFPSLASPCAIRSRVSYTTLAVSRVTKPIHQPLQAQILNVRPETDVGSGQVQTEVLHRPKCYNLPRPDPKFTFKRNRPKQSFSVLPTEQNQIFVQSE